MAQGEIKCKGCGKKLYTYEKAHFRKYESPVKVCKKCGMKYADYRCHEIAIEGIPSDTFRASSYVILLVIGGFVLYRGFHLWGMYELGLPDSMQWLMPVMFFIIGGILILGGLIELFTIKTGIKKRRFDRLRKESEIRLEDKTYVYILQDLGYTIPDKYL